MDALFARTRWGAVLAGVVVAGIAGGARADARVRLDVSLDTPYVLAGRWQKVFLKVGLTGAPLEPAARRPPANVAVVLDRSGSMSGEKIVKAREAALTVADRLGGDDILAVVAYNHGVQVLVPATKLSDRADVRRRIEALFAAGNTALFAGVSKGAWEVRKFLDDNRVNRVILVSDGLANVGPSSVGELADLGRSLAREGISVTTIGLGDGYNEDLMVELARAGDGNHAFAETASDLARIFAHELGDVLSVVAREVTIRIRCAPGVRPVRVLGRNADISGNDVVTSLAQVYASQEKYVLVELDVSPSAAGASKEVAEVGVAYADPVSRTAGALAGRAFATWTDSAATVEIGRNKAVTEASVELIATDNNRLAVTLRDQGKVEEAERTLQMNVDFLNRSATSLGSKKLMKLKLANEADTVEMKKPVPDWNKQRKVMRKRQYEFDSQQAW
ncbi:MAG: VWA domain-containing protein [Deltaproteobacteria bacterium]|nr:VWA domain-containing protein [Deltaproteobacteria bacterium]